MSVSNGQAFIAEICLHFVFHSNSRQPNEHSIEPYWRSLKKDIGLQLFAPPCLLRQTLIEHRQIVTMRLDQLIVKKGLAQTRARARDAIMRGCVSIDGKITNRPGRAVGDGANIELKDPVSQYVSRAALKLDAALETSGFDVTGKSCLDIGASTGGFTQVLLQHGASQVIAIDVGHGQMAAKIADDRRVINIEGVNARQLEEVLPDSLEFEVIVCDVSFISLKLALPPALDLASPGSFGIFLVKPQFEAGRDHIGRGGVIRDAEIGEKVAKGLCHWIDDQARWQHTHLLPSPLKGGSGNQEYLLCARKQPYADEIS